MPPKRKPLTAALAAHPADEPVAPQPSAPVQRDTPPPSAPPRATGKSRKVQQAVYLAPAVYEQLRRIAFDEHVRMHDVLMEGLSLAFERRGLPTIAELSPNGDGVQ
jgi:hypothetical protein